MSNQNAINQKYFTSQLGLNLPNVSLPLGIYSTTTSGDFDLYTVPAGRRCLVYSLQMSMTAFANNANVTAEIKSGGVYYNMGAPQSIVSGSTALFAILYNAIILEAGESLSVNVSAANTFTYALGAIEFDNTSAFKGVRSLNMASGDNLLYTVPVGKTACMIDPTCGIGNGNIIITQQNTVTFTYYVSIVPNGQVISATYKCLANSTIAGSLSPVGSILLVSQPYATLSAGDKIYINSTSAAANAFISVLEI